METIGTRCINMNAITLAQVFPPSDFADRLPSLTGTLACVR